MVINFRKLNKQIKPFAPEASGPGYIFIATDEQKKKGLFSVSKKGSKRSLIKALLYQSGMMNIDEFREEFTL